MLGCPTSGLRQIREGRVLPTRRVLDNAGFAAEVRRLSGALVEMGVGRGDVVAVVLANSVELVSIMFAAWRLGAVLTPVNPALTRPEAQYQVADSGAQLVVVDESCWSKVEDASRARALSTSFCGETSRRP